MLLLTHYLNSFYAVFYVVFYQPNLLFAAMQAFKKQFNNFAQVEGVNPVMIDGYREALEHNLVIRQKAYWILNLVKPRRRHKDNFTR